MFNFLKKIKNHTLLVIIILSFSSCFSPQLSNGEKARKYLENKEYAKAIEHYFYHISDRLSLKDRPSWENPFLYYLDIGDVYLKQNQPVKALEFYLLAQHQKVSKELVSDRVRQVGIYYLKQNEFDKALNHLQEYQEMDPQFYNMLMDRIAKELVVEENS